MEEVQQLTPALKAEFTQWLEPVLREKTAGQVEQMEAHFFANAATGKRSMVNNYYCAKGHRIVTVDRGHAHDQRTIRCPICRKESRSVFYCCDQTEPPTHEFYYPKDPTAFPERDRPALKQGGYAFKRIYDNEPTRLRNKLKITL